MPALNVELNAVDYSVPLTASAAAFTIDNTGGTPVKVSADIAAELFGADQAWQVLQNFFTVQNVQNDAANWEQVAIQAQSVAGLEQLNDLLGQAGGLVLGAYLNPAGDAETAAAAADALNSFAQDTSQEVAEVGLAAVGINDAAQLIDNAKAEFDTLETTFKNGGVLDYATIKTVLNETLAGLNAGATISTALDSYFDGSTIDDIESFGTSFFGGVASSISGLFSTSDQALLKTATDLSDAVGTISDFQDKISFYQSLLSAGTADFGPLTQAGILAAETALKGNVSIDPNATVGPPPPDEGANGNQVVSGSTAGGYAVTGGLGGMGATLDFSSATADVSFHPTTQGPSPSFQVQSGQTNVGFDNVQNFTVIGGTGVNTFNGVGSHADIFIGTAGSRDSFQAGTGAAVLIGGPGADTLTGGAGNDAISGGAGNDAITTGGGVDSIDGGAGLNYAVVDLSGLTKAVTFDYAQAASAQGITLVDGAHIQNVDEFDLLTGSGDDQITIDTNHASFGFPQEDEIQTGAGNDSLTVTGPFGTDIDFSAGLGTDHLTVDLSAATTAVDMQLNRDAISGTIFAGAASLTFESVESLAVNGGAANDDLVGGAGNDVFNGNGGADTITGGGGNDMLSGGDGNDTLIGGAGNDTFSGGAGNDAITGGGGVDFIDGGAGLDYAVVDLSAQTQAVTFDYLQAASAGGVTLVDGTHIQNVEEFDLITGSGADQIKLDTFHASFGFSQEDEIQTGAGDDTLTVTGPFGAPIDFFAGDGMDHLTVNLSASTTAIDMQVNRDAVSGTIFTNLANLTFESVESLTVSGGAAGDVLIGGAGNDVFTGNGGNDTITAGAGRDIAVYDVASSAATLTHNANGSWTVAAGSDGTDTLNGVELLRFADRDVSLVAQWANRDNFDDDAKSDFMIENAGGAVVAGEVSSGQTAFANITALGPEWSFQGDGDFNGDGTSDFLIQNSGGAVVVGDVAAGQTSFVQVTALGAEWQFVGTGDFLGDGQSDFLIQNTVGAVVVGEVVGGQAVFTSVAALGSEWTFRGAGDFLGDGKSDFLIQNSGGAVVVGEVVNGQAAYTQVTALGPEWNFRGAGDFLGEGQDQFLIENTSGAIVISDYLKGQIHFTQIAALGPEWTFKGAGDFLGEGHDQFLIENTSGAVVVGDWTGGQIHYTQVSALGSEWLFHL